MELNTRTRILDSWSIEQMTRRIAHQIFENHYREKELVLVGVSGLGNDIASLLEKELKAISSLSLVRYEIALDKKNPLRGERSFSGELSDLKNKTVFLVDDVLNSGRTLSYAVSHLLAAAPKRLRTVVIVDRIHREFPIRADFVGMTLSTNLKEHVSVERDGNTYAAYLD